MSSSFSVVRQPLVNIVIDRLKEVITSRQWKIGEKIPNENELSVIFAVGRNTIREAIRVLSHAGMLDVLQGDGTYVISDVDPSDVINKINKSGLKEHFEIQYLLEHEAASYAAIRRNENDLKKMRAALLQRAQYDSLNSIGDLIEKDLDFHCAVIEATHNDAMIALYKYFSISVYRNLKKLLLLNEYPEPNQQAHERIYNAIEAKDPDEAKKSVEAMLTPIIEKLSSL